MHVRSSSSYLASLFCLFCLASPARAEDLPVSDKLKAQLLTDEKISELCQASIKQKFEMVDAVDENGNLRKVPRCVANYEAMRSVADSYLKQEETAKTEINTAVSLCREDPDQASCLDAGNKLATKAAELHETLSQNADGAIELLAGSASAK